MFFNCRLPGSYYTARMLWGSFHFNLSGKVVCVDFTYMSSSFIWICILCQRSCHHFFVWNCVLCHSTRLRSTPLEVDFLWNHNMNHLLIQNQLIVSKHENSNMFGPNYLAANYSPLAFRCTKMWDKSKSATFLDAHCASISSTYPCQMSVGP